LKKGPFYNHFEEKKNKKKKNTTLFIYSKPQKKKKKKKKNTSLLAFSIFRRVWRYQREVIRIRKSKKNKQNNDQKKKYKRTNNDLQNVHIKVMINTNPPKNRGWTQVLPRLNFFATNVLLWITDLYYLPLVTSNSSCKLYFFYLQNITHKTKDWVTQVTSISFYILILWLYKEIEITRRKFYGCNQDFWQFL
jgi:hypothetical protein